MTYNILTSIAFTSDVEGSSGQAGKHFDQVPQESHLQSHIIRSLLEMDITLSLQSLCQFDLHLGLYNEK